MWSSGAEALLGWKADEVLGQKADLIFTPEAATRGMPEKEANAAQETGRAEDERWHIRRGGSRFWGSGVFVTLKGEAAPPGFVKIVRDRTKERQAVMDLRQSEQRFRTLVENIPQLVWRSRSLGDRTWGSPQWEIFTGLSLDESVGHGWLNAVHPEDRGATLEAWQEAERTGRLYVEHRTRRAADGAYRWFQTRGTKLSDESGKGGEWFGTSTDVDDLRRALERQQVLIRELHHRTGNLLGVVNAIAAQTIARSASLEDFRERFYNRIAALARVQSLVAHTAEIELRELVESEVTAHADEANERIKIDGPPIVLTEKTAETLALALHELSTNAVKYGALANPAGKLEITWSAEDGPLALEWRESGFQVPQAGSRRGYGRELIEVALPFALGARTRFDLRDNGVHCLIELPEHEWTAGKVSRDKDHLEGASGGPDNLSPKSDAPLVSDLEPPISCAATRNDAEVPTCRISVQQSRLSF
jgi:PAS domain S-box-containing protein